MLPIGDLLQYRDHAALYADSQIGVLRFTHDLVVKILNCLTFFVKGNC